MKSHIGDNRESFDKTRFPRQANVLNTVMDNITHGMVVVGPDYRMLAFNRHFEEMFQLPPGAVEVGVDFRNVLRTWAEVTGQDQKMLDRAIFQLDEPATYQVEFPQFINGELRWCLLTHNPLYRKGFVRTFTDITDRKQAENELRESELRFRTLAEATFEGICVSHKGQIDDCNDQFGMILGYGRSELVGLNIADLIPPEMRQAVMLNIIAMQDSHLEHEMVRKDGTICFVEARGKNIAFESQQVRITSIRDITERKHLEEQLRQSQKIEAIGTLAGGIAHDFNNLLQGVFGYISIAKLNASNDNSIAALEQAEKALLMSANLTTQLLTFSRGGSPVKKNISLRSVIENSVRFALSGSCADYGIKLDEELWQVEADEGQIGQVIQNIVLNADQAMPMGGTILIEAKNVQALKNGLPHLPEEGKFVEISIRDNGTGISDEYLPKIFDPYFTTKAKGSGLGLATCYSIIKNHGGVIHVSSKVGSGAIFDVYLPAIRAEKAVPQPPKLSQFVRKGKILLMDDEEMVRGIAGKMIEVIGHEVEFAEHGEAAIGKYEAAMESGKPFDIVILDLTIRGGIGGRETIARLLAVNPDIRAIVSSGYSEDAIMSDYLGYGFSARLTKPYMLEELSDVLNNLLANQ